MSNDRLDAMYARIGRAYLMARTYRIGVGHGLESPIEEMLFLALVGRGYHLVDGVKSSAAAAGLLARGFDPKMAVAEGNCGLYVFLQHNVGPYRADIVIAESVGDCLVAVECDGKEFHDKDNAQASRDRARDRAFTKRGFRVLRFSGAEIYADALACATEIEELVSVAATACEMQSLGDCLKQLPSWLDRLSQ